VTEEQVPIKIKIKNTSKEPISIPTEEEPVTIAASKDGDVPLESLRTTEFADHLARGNVALPRTALDGLDEASRAAASNTITDVVLRVAPRFLAHHGELSSSLANLASLRDRYNELHGSTVTLLASAKALAPGVASVIQASELLSASEDDLVAAAEKKLEKHLEVDPDDLQKWYLEHKLLEAAYTKAVAARDATRSLVAQQLEATKTELAAAATTFSKADPKKDVGAQVNWG
jgi:hypothetical protein